MAILALQALLRVNKNPIAQRAEHQNQMVEVPGSRGKTCDANIAFIANFVCL